MSAIYECEKCGNGLLPGDLKCKICGFFSGRVCRACENHVPSGQRICSVCSFDLGPEYPLAGLADTDPDIPLLTSLPHSEAPTVKMLLKDALSGEPSSEEPELPPSWETQALAVATPEPPAPPPFSKGQTRPLPEAHATLVSDSRAFPTMPPPPLIAQETPSSAPPPPPKENAFLHRENQASPDAALDRPLLGKAAPMGYETVVQAHMPPPADSGFSGRDRRPERLDASDYALVLKTCEELIQNRTDLYGVFGRPESGKTLFIYALGKVLKGWFGTQGQGASLGNYALDHNWENLLHFQEDLFLNGVQMPTARGLHFYKASVIGKAKKHRHVAVIDIRGEQFEQIEDWTREITGFFLTYLTHCKGLFVFLDLDPDTVCKSATEVIDRHERREGRPFSESEKRLIIEAWRFKRDQMSHIVKFLSVAATVGKMTSVNDFESQKSALAQAHRAEQFGSRTVQVPVALCISKADRIKDYRFDGYPAIVPGSADYLGNPWHVLETFFPTELDNLTRLVPQLKVEWVSSTGENFNPQRGITNPLGLASVFQHVVRTPPPKWALSARQYQLLARFFGLQS